jgi:hypothetical protein
MMMMMMNMMMTTMVPYMYRYMYVQPIYLLFYTLLWVSEGHRFLERTKYASSGVFLSS